jgi:DNA-binding NtrC family response regulator
MAFSVLIIDDEEALCQTLARILAKEGYGACYTINPFEVEVFLERERPDLIIMDVRMPGRGGLQVLEQLKHQNCLLPILMISGYAGTESIVQAMKIGAANFYSKPLKTQALLDEIRTFASHERDSIRSDLPSSAPSILTSDPGMQRILGLVDKVAATDVSVVITGESGTGKELIAEAIHGRGLRAPFPLVKINCAAIPETLLESELFGHEKGAFTDAASMRIGKFEEAEKGSIFLDEIGEMSLRTQAKVLRILQEKRFERVGSNKVRNLDVRFIAATNKSFDQMIREGAFRSDLYYRLSVVHLEIPPLRERRGDIPILADHFLKEFSALYGKPVQGFKPEVYKIFQAHSWPGNVRELRNCVERAVIFSEGALLDETNLPLHYDEVCRESVAEYNELLDRVKREKILEALDRANGNKTVAADLLNITRRTLYNKMKGLGIPL